MEKELKPVLEAYGLHPTSLQKKREVWKITTLGGTFALKKTKASSTRLERITASLEGLARFKVDGPIYPLPERGGRLFLEREEGNYLLTPWIEGRTGEELFAETDWVKEAMERLARIHRVMRQEVKTRETLLPAGQELLKNWNRRMKQMIAWKERVAKHAYPSPVDAVFMANVEDLLEMSGKAAAELEAGILEWEKEEESVITFCHGRLSTDHVLVAEHPYFLNFTHSVYDLPVRDLVYFLRHFLRKTRRKEELESWLSAYLAKNELDPFQRRLLPLSFLYPIEVTRFLEQYYEGKMKGSWFEIELVRRFEKLLDEQAFFRLVVAPPRSF
ncbi:hypothetical protein CULT_630026 [[Clostridium] ultunense Esp]|uniref:phosphotransferase n=1 Tax=Thermicanus aegyptius TaxID=94009 RepID=UPI0002B6F028|nr:phosphotransferase [Thermicanus aegyptius]CCQ97442.1 hypothetical protein CULT_630026 [[Clostridium] ultunense Esp]